MAGTAAALVAATAIALAAVGGDDDLRTERPAGGAAVAERSSPLPDRPRRAAPAWFVWADAGVLHLPGRRVGVPEGAVPVVGGRAVHVWSPSGEVVAVHRDSGVVSPVTTDAAAPPVAGNDAVAWVSAAAARDGDAVVTLGWYREERDGRLLERPEVTVEDQQAFPVPCCDGSFRLRGITQFQTLLVDSSAGPWAWGASEGQEGTPYVVPDSDDHVTALAEPGASVAQLATKIVLRRDDVHSFLDDPYGNVLGGPVRPVTLDGAVFDAGLQRVALVDHGRVVVRDLGSAAETRLALPAAAEVRAIGWTWSGRRSVVAVDLVDAGGSRGLYACGRDGVCSSDAELPLSAVVAW